ncbi:uncharacterized protein SPPG_09422 [Spizellomyces punctatus DAOM BR117]|uniref:DNA topoisomerase (ATP-hydrolyzing) n=1 Tax=Spizellomyces punctatus (strain DAOM BR117) TaxID=645134 RepID=A0A0L0H9T3_SPIPD|nr:uncharacterized protein SPPG_09422 [Spizellomyces punctatus DAOM BR117]KNC97947.1 hypothetical protein SPPG_09422 [Spizellomyces punctatus DAOM BR117]|eukprot:XP_016605987.1 hypothetical protein SPPG_09422 [Spizellomyces punctatus DAOM BR117]
MQLLTSNYDDLLLGYQVEERGKDEGVGGYSPAHEGEWAPGCWELFIKDGESTEWVDHANQDFAFRHDDDVLWDLTEDEAICFRDRGAEGELSSVDGHLSELWDDDFAEVTHESCVEMDIIWEGNEFLDHESEAESSHQNQAVSCDEDVLDTTEQKHDHGGSTIRANTLSSNMVHYSPDAHAEWFSEDGLEDTAENDSWAPPSLSREHDQIQFRSEDDDMLFTYEADSNSSSLKFELSVDSDVWADDRLSYKDETLVPDILGLTAGKEMEMDIDPLISSQLEKDKKLSKIPFEIVLVGDPCMDQLEVGSLWKATARSREWMLEQVDAVLSRIRQAPETGKQHVLKMISRSQKVWKYDDQIPVMRLQTKRHVYKMIPDGNGRFDIYVRILEYCKDLLQKNVTATKREIYYRDVALFKSQRVVDQAIEDLACTFAVQRHCLNMVASSKGLVHGDLRLHMVDRTIVDCLQGGHQSLTTAKFVLVIEKEATFRTVVADRFAAIHGPCILITGKGYPDVSTRRLVKRLSEIEQRAQVEDGPVERLPVLALVDCDPHGIEIYLCYKFGSKAMAFDSHNLACPTIRWIGLRPRDWINTDYQIDFNKLLVLTERDRRRALGMLRRGYIKQFSDIRTALSRILFYGRKAEIQAVPPDILTGTYLPRIVAEQIN